MAFLYYVEDEDKNTLLAVALEKAPYILASFCDDIRYIEKSGTYTKEELVHELLS